VQSLLAKKIEDYKFVNEQQLKYGNYERIFQNTRSGYAILSYGAVHFQNEQFRKTLGIKQDASVKHTFIYIK